MFIFGSTSVLKGVFLPHKNVIAISKAYCATVVIKDDDVFICFRPLAHVFELLCENVCILDGITIKNSESMQRRCQLFATNVLDCSVAHLGLHIQRNP